MYDVPVRALLLSYLCVCVSVCSVWMRPCAKRPPRVTLNLESIFKMKSEQRCALG